MAVKQAIYGDMVPGRRWGTYCTLLNSVPESENGAWKEKGNMCTLLNIVPKNEKSAKKFKIHSRQRYDFIIIDLSEC